MTDVNLKNSRANKMMKFKCRLSIEIFGLLLHMLSIIITIFKLLENSFMVEPNFNFSDKDFSSYSAMLIKETRTVTHDVISIVHVVDRILEENQS